MKNKTCQCCLKPLESIAWNAKYHKHWCEPHPDFLMECTMCGETKGYHEFYDYRGVHNGGKLLSECKVCKLSRSKEKTKKGSCVICGKRIEKKYCTKTCGSVDCMKERNLIANRRRQDERTGNGDYRT